MFPPGHVVHLYQGYHKSDTAFTLERVSNGTYLQFASLLMLFILIT